MASNILFERNLALVEEGHVGSSGDQWINIVGKGHNIKDINDLIKHIDPGDAPILTFVAFNHKNHSQRCSAIFLLTYSSPELALETLPQIVSLDSSDPVKLEALSGLTRLVAAEVDGAFINFLNSYTKVKPSIRKAALSDLVENSVTGFRQSYDVLLQTASFLGKLMVEGPPEDAMFAIEEVQSGHFPSSDFTDISDVIRESLFEASSVRPETKVKRAALKGLSQIGV